ncbi:MAG: hypothetical protein JST86_04675 [Bacteroidetes bacterium]|nr:hypothetical protein [Bacteroidota bacterium]
MKQHWLYYPAIVCSAAVLMSSCYTPRYVYSPAAHNVPVFTQKGETKLAANYSVNLNDNTVKENVPTKQKARGYDLQSAVAVTNHWAIQGNFYHRKERNAGDFDNNLKDSVVINYTRNLGEVGIGYFHGLAQNQLAVAQIFVGMGWGKFSFTDNGRDQNNVYRSRYFSSGVTKVFIQPSFTIRSRHQFAASLSSRVSFIWFHHIQTDYNAAEMSNYNLDSLNYSPRVFWEPATVYRFGFRKLPGMQLEFQAGLAFLASARFVDARAFNFSGGLLFDLPKLFANNHHSSKN